MKNLLTIAISLLQFAMKIEFFSQDEMINSTDFQGMYRLIDKFLLISFDFKIMKFLWLKLFADDNIYFRAITALILLKIRDYEGNLVKSKDVKNLLVSLENLQFIDKI